MKNRVAFILDAIDNPNATKFERILYGCFWAICLLGTWASFLFFAYIFS